MARIFRVTRFAFSVTHILKIASSFSVLRVFVEAYVCVYVYVFSILYIIYMCVYLSLYVCAMLRKIQFPNVPWCVLQISVINEQRHLAFLLEQLKRI